jgi:transmembrane sensor
VDNEAKKNLFRRFLSGECTPEEQERVYEYLTLPENDELLHQLIAEQEWKPTEIAEATNEQEELVYHRVWSRLRNRVEASQPIPLTIESPRISRWPTGIYRVAAAVALLVLSAVAVTYLWHSNPQPLVYQEQWVPAGQKASLTLPDGSHVWLNAQSRLRYPQAFATDIRQVELQGEAFFEVKRDPAHPFVIRTGTLQTKVLGTSFNVSAYPGEKSVEVAVLTGKVRVSDSTLVGDNWLVLVPNQKAVYNHQQKSLRSETVTNAADYRAWTDDRLVLEEKSVEEIARLLSRRFAVQITVENPKINRCVLTTTFDKPTLEGILRVVCTYVGATYHQQGNRILIRGKGC